MREISGRWNEHGIKQRNNVQYIVVSDRRLEIMVAPLLAEGFEFSQQNGPHLIISHHSINCCYYYNPPTPIFYYTPPINCNKFPPIHNNQIKMEPSPRRPFSRTGNPRLTSSRASNQPAQTHPVGHEQPTSSSSLAHVIKYLPHATLLLKSFLRVRQQSDVKHCFYKLKEKNLLAKTTQREGLLRLKRVMGNKIYSNTLNAFATVFICEANKSQIRKRELLTRNKAIFLRLWKGVNHLIIRKQQDKVEEVFGIIGAHAKTNKKQQQLKIAHVRQLGQLFRQKLRTSFEIVKNSPLNRSKIFNLSFSALERLMKTKKRNYQISALEILKRLQTRKEEFELVKAADPINQREKQLKEQLEDLVRENKEGEERYVQEEIEFEKRKDAYQNELEELRRRNERLASEIAALKENHKQNAGSTVTELKIYQNIYNNMLNFVHHAPEEMNKEELVQSLLTPLNEWAVSVDVIKMENECLQDLIDTYSKEVRVKIPPMTQGASSRKMSRYTFEYLVKENSDLYGMLAILIENSKVQRNDQGFNSLISSFVEIQEKFAGVAQTLTSKK